jgi:hypothetical protein
MKENISNSKKMGGRGREREREFKIKRTSSEKN